MTIPVSTAPAAQTYLLQAIKAQAQFDSTYLDMLIRIGQPGRDLPNDSIVITGVRSRSVNWQTYRGDGGQFTLDEKYNLGVECSTWAAAGDSDDTSTYSTQSLERAWQLVGYVETAVRNDPSLGELVDIAHPLDAAQEGPEWTSGTSGAGLLCAVNLLIHVECLN